MNLDFSNPTVIAVICAVVLLIVQGLCVNLAPPPHPFGLFAVADGLRSPRGKPAGGHEASRLAIVTVADELIRRATELSSARVTFIEDSSLLEPVGGVGAFIRYRVSASSAAPYEQSGVVSRSEALVEA